jgi:hypothetical protein
LVSPGAKKHYKKAKDETNYYHGIGMPLAAYVMEHESLRIWKWQNTWMNTFICIKVDREERPDVGIHDRRWLLWADVHDALALPNGNLCRNLLS